MRLPVVPMLLVGAVAALVGTGRPWVRAQVQDPVLGRLEVPVTGTEVVPVAGAMVLLALAATLAAVLTRGWVRTVALALAVGSGAWLVWAGARCLADPDGSVRGAVLATAASSAQQVQQATATPWPWLVVVAGATLLVAGLAGLRDPVGPRGQASVRRGAAGRSGTVRPEEQHRRDAAEAWDDLTAGRDPTAGPIDDPTTGPRDGTDERTDPAG